LRVLIVEDEFLVADYLCDLIEEAGHEVVAITPSGEQAVACLEQKVIDLAILDIKLKGKMTGIDVAASTRNGAIPHVFISGSGDPTTFKAAQQTEPLAFLQKPLDARRLRSILDQVAGGSRPNPTG
jgi:DNA-binding NtrC family response regulator